MKYKNSAGPVSMNRSSFSTACNLKLKLLVDIVMKVTRLDNKGKRLLVRMVKTQGTCTNYLHTFYRCYTMVKCTLLFTIIETKTLYS